MRVIFRYISLLLLCCLGTVLHLHAQDEGDTIIDVEAPTVETVEVDEPVNETGSDDHARRYERLRMDEIKLEALRKKKEFQYPDLDSLDMSRNYSREPKEDEKKVTVPSAGFDLSVLLWLILGIVAVIIALQLSGLNIRQIISPPKLVNKEQMHLRENIHEIQYETAIREAIKAGYYALATRLMYLQGLKTLSDKKLITWMEHKTNWQYVHELKNEKLRNSFRTVTHIFEYIQYGNMAIDETKFARIQEAFVNFKSNIA